MKKFLLLALLLLLAACQTIMRTAYGIKEPDVENEKSVNKYLDKKGLVTGNVYAYDYEHYKARMNEGGIPDVIIFNSKGEYIPYGDPGSCNASAFDFIEKLDAGTAYPISADKLFATVTGGLHTLAGQPHTVALTDDADYHVFIRWGVFAGRLNKDHVKVWEQQAMNNKTARIKVYKLDLDIMEWWGAENLAHFGK